MQELMERLSKLKDQQRSMIEAKGVHDTMLIAKNELVIMEAMITADKDKMKGLLSQRGKLLHEATQKICLEVDKSLSCGTSKIQITEKNIYVGWVIDKEYHPMSNLSGGEKIEFINALSQVLYPSDNPLTHLELAETGDRVEDILHAVLSSQKGQVIACTCSWDEEYSHEGWERIALSRCKQKDLSPEEKEAVDAELEYLKQHSQEICCSDDKDYEVRGETPIETWRHGSMFKVIVASPKTNGRW